MEHLRPLTLVAFGPLLMVTTIRTLRPSLRRLPSQLSSSRISENKTFCQETQPAFFYQRFFINTLSLCLLANYSWKWTNRLHSKGELMGFFHVIMTFRFNQYFHAERFLASARYMIMPERLCAGNEIQGERQRFFQKNESRWKIIQQEEFESVRRWRLLLWDKNQYLIKRRRNK